MNYYDSFINIGLYALIASVVFQSVVLLIAMLIKKNFSPQPITEIILRPFLIKIIDKLNRSERSDFALIIRGTITFSIIFAMMCAVSYIVYYIMDMVGYGQYTDIILLFIILSPVMVLKTAYAVSVDKPMDGAYLCLSRTLNQNLIPADKHGLRRAGCKAMALSLTEYIIAPLLFYILGGVIGAYLYVSLSLFVRFSGQNSKAFTSIFAIIYKVMNFVASIIGVIVVFLSSIFSAGGKPLRVIAAFKKTSIMVEASIAYAQNIALAGSYQNLMGETIKSDWVGSDGATAKLNHKDVLRVMIQYGIIVFVCIAILLALNIYT